MNQKQLSKLLVTIFYRNGLTSQRLIMTTRNYLGAVLLSVFNTFWVVHSFAQCTSVEFTISKQTICINEPIIAESVSLADSVVWDFCPDDLLQEPVFTERGIYPNEFERVFGMDMVFDGINWYGFITDRTNGNLLKFDYGNSLQNPPNVVDLGTFDNMLVSAEDITVKKINGIWYALITNSRLSSPNNYISLLDFGENLNNDTPVYTNLGNFGQSVRMTGIDFAWDGYRIVALVAIANKTVVMVDFGASFYSNPTGNRIITTSSITFSIIFDLSIYEYCDKWYLIIPTNGYLNLVDLGTNLFQSNISSTKYSFSNIDLQSNEIKVINDGQRTLVLISSNRSEMVYLNLGEIGVDTPTEIEFVQTMPEFPAFDIVYQEGVYYLHGVEFKSDRLLQLSHSNDCGASTPSGSGNDINFLSFSSSGDKKIVVKNIVNGKINTTNTQTITVTPNTAPDITTSSQNICLSNPINFTSSNVSGDINTYAWSFGDTNTSPNANPSHTYTTAGEYEVTLDVESSNGCHNFTNQTIKVYDPPAPNFTLPSGVVCTNQDYTFVNNTTDNFDGNLTYEWQVDGMMVSSERELVYQFADEGAKEIKLITSISGCSIEQVQNFANVNLGATPLYSYDTNSICLDDPVTFANQSTGDGITAYSWSFGDTNTSTDVSPTHSYSSAGEYTVSLEVTNSAGCITRYEELVQIHRLPLVDFESELVCTDLSTQLTDLTTVASANITSWDWNFGDPGSGGNNVSDEENPLHNFSDTGDYTISLSAISNYGCESSSQKIVTVLESPNVDFDVEYKCLGEAFEFTDMSISNTGGSIISRTWNINGSIYTVQNPSHVFDTPGTYSASLTIRSDNLCTISSSKSVVVNNLPVVDFSLSSLCVNTTISISDESTLDNDNIVNWGWEIDRKEAGNSSNIEYIFDESGSHQVRLRVITERGCIVAKNETININELPVANFDPTPQYIAPPAEVFFDNSSVNAISYTWDFGDGSPVSTLNSPIHQYTQLGTYDVILTVQNADGCIDEITKKVFVVNPEIDLSIDEITSFNEGRNVLFTMSNLGTIPVKSLKAIISINDEVSIEESFDLEILPSASTIARSLNFSIPQNGNIDFICIDLISGEGIDVDLSNNKQCLNINSSFKVLNPYPIPASQDQPVTLPLIGDKGEEIQIAMFDPLGKQVLFESVSLSQKGLNNIELSLFSLRKGVYHLQVQSSDTSKSFRIFVN